MKNEIRYAELFAEEGAYIMKREYSSSVRWKSCFVAHFGVSPRVCAILWMKTRHSVPESSIPKHMLFGMLLLKVYCTESVLASLCNVSENTFRKWAWIHIKALATMDIVSEFFTLGFSIDF